MSANQESPLSRELIERLLYGVGVVSAVGIAAGVFWLFHAGTLGHWFGYAVAILIAAGLASIRLGALGIGLLLTAAAGLLFGPFGLLAGLLLTIVLLMARR